MEEKIVQAINKDGTIIVFTETKAYWYDDKKKQFELSATLFGFEPRPKEPKKLLWEEMKCMRVSGDTSGACWDISQDHMAKDFADTAKQAVLEKIDEWSSGKLTEFILDIPELKKMIEEL